jgi:hypothetical protein
VHGPKPTQLSGFRDLLEGLAGHASHFYIQYVVKYCAGEAAQTSETSWMLFRQIRPPPPAYWMVGLNLQAAGCD